MKCTYGKNMGEVTIEHDLLETKIQLKMPEVMQVI